MDKSLKTVVEKLSDGFMNDLYLGGSAALSEFFGPIFDEPEDYDFFYYADRPFATYIGAQYFNLLGFDVISKNVSQYIEYKIRGQYGHYKLKCRDTNKVVDFIMIYPQHMVESLGSSLAAVLYQVRFGQIYTPAGYGNQELKSIVSEMIRNKEVQVICGGNTLSQEVKILSRCNELKMRIFYTYTWDQEIDPDLKYIY